MNDAIEVEVNLMASGKIKQKDKLKKVKEEPLASTSQSTSDAKFDIMMKEMERLLDKLFVDERSLPRKKKEPQIINQQGKYKRKKMMNNL